MPNNPVHRARSLCAPLFSAVAVLALSAPASAAEKTPFMFPSDKSKGCYPEGTLLRDGDGALYGTTSGCHTTQNDTVFKLAPPRAVRVTGNLLIETVTTPLSRFDSC